MSYRSDDGEYGYGDDDIYDDYDDCHSDAPADEIDDGGDAVDGPACGPKTGPIHHLGTLLGRAPIQVDSLATLNGKADWLPPLPGLYIGGVGHVALPVVESTQASEISRWTEEHGSSVEALSTSVRFENPAWRTGLDTVKKLIAKQLGLPDLVLNLALFRVQLHQPNATRNDRPADEHVQRSHFATLIIQLPSLCEGVNRQMEESLDRKQAFDILFDEDDDSARYGCHFAVRVAGSNYTTPSLQSGYRLTVEYAVLWPESTDRKVPVTNISSSLKHDVAQALESIAQDSRIICTPLDQPYEIADIERMGCAALKAKDRTLLSTLREASQVAGKAADFVFYLANAEMERILRARGRSFTDAQWSKEATDVAEDVVGLHDLDGKKVVSQDFIDFSSLTAQLHPDKVLNPDGKTWLQMWHGHRVTTYEDDGSCIQKIQTYHKLVLIGWPREDDAGHMFGLMGAKVFFDRILAADGPTPAKVEEFLHLLIRKPSSSDSKAALDASFHQRVFDLLVSNEELHHLIRLFLDACTDSSELLGGGCGGQYGVGAEENTGRRTLLKLICSARLWTDESIRAKIKSLFAGRREDVVSVLQTCLNNQVEAWRWRPFLDLLIEVFTNPKPRTSVFPTLYEKDRPIWRIAIQSVDPTLCQLLVSEQMKAPKSSLDHSIKMLGRLKPQHPAIFETKRSLLIPMLDAREAMLQSELRDLPPGKADFKNPNAVFPDRREVQAFLRGPERKMKVGSFASIIQARAFVNKNENHWTTYSCTCTADGKGKDAFVEIKKAGHSAVEVARTKQRLQADLDVVLFLLAPGSVPPTSSAPWETPELRFHLAVANPDGFTVAPSAPATGPAALSQPTNESTPRRELDQVDSGRDEPAPKRHRQE
ncbi:unnamed protein product [Tilletia laevis]|uniref:Uncharacterized protein n=4 Tax=Tilletia TaxID=13289 RepID=A0A8X7MR07_9BASI|nr:hypothetical protein CF328_g4415 [Tilletia controversa]KAE8198828.1 hypothetical protein CF336_g1485 [Tilletia laevis]KAE8260742.1 hypothetical protein A4X03_0g3711 [Tilletia caries]KAE8246029.1 hypothetical protein A4X06_0g5241 [Tilletia controversa]CAD6890064.1 unnamed protein product [Tilletia caries]